MHLEPRNVWIGGKGWGKEKATGPVKALKAEIVASLSISRAAESWEAVGFNSIEHTAVHRTYHIHVHASGCLCMQCWLIPLLMKKNPGHIFLD
jgi:hypothetical protein